MELTARDLEGTTFELRPIKNLEGWTELVMIAPDKTERQLAISHDACHGEHVHVEQLSDDVSVLTCLDCAVNAAARPKE
jgi:hypothetical protein